LKVHTHLAKQYVALNVFSNITDVPRMLYDFHHTQTAKKPGSVHATYLITGVLQPEQQPLSQATNGLLSQHDEDTPMESSPFPSSYPEPAPEPSFESEDAEPAEEPVHNTTVLLVREEELEEAKTEFEEIQSIFVYSLEPGPLKDFQLLTQCNREVTKEFWTEDPLQAYPKYGLITNKDVRRRTGKRQPPPAVAVPSSMATKSHPTKSAPVKETTPAAKKEEPAKPATSAKPSTIKRQSSDLFKSFAKSKPPKLKTDDSNATSASASVNPSPVDKEDDELQGMSEDEATSDIDEEMLEAEAAKATEARKARKEKEERLKAMMDEEDEDEEMQDADADGETPAEPMDESEALDQPKEPEKKEEVTVTNGRRRGKRKVMKKRTYKDEDGYLGKNYSRALIIEILLITWYSHKRRSRVGIFQRRRTRAQEAKAQLPSQASLEEGSSSSERPRQSHELLQEEIAVNAAKYKVKRTDVPTSVRVPPGLYSQVVVQCQYSLEVSSSSSTQYTSRVAN
jgi:DNA polymerase delta subunit 3